MRASVHTPWLLPLLFVIAALLGAGCGAGSDVEQEYRAGLVQLQADLRDANEASRAASSATEPAQRAERLGDAQQALEAAARRAEQLDPPADVRRQHRQLATALRDYADLFAQLASLETGDPRETELYSSAGDIVARLEAANRALKKAGYDVGSSKDARD